MTLDFSRKEKIALSIEGGTCGRGTEKEIVVKSSWVSPMDISNVIPKTIFSVDEYNGYRRFELAVSVNVCPSIFARTKLITLYPRYQIVNLLGDDLIVTQDGMAEKFTHASSLAQVSLFTGKDQLPPKVRLGRAVQGSGGMHVDQWLHSTRQDRDNVHQTAFADKCRHSTYCGPGRSSPCD
jgi:hypothetical protein